MTDMFIFENIDAYVTKGSSSGATLRLIIQEVAVHFSIPEGKKKSPPSHPSLPLPLPPQQTENLVVYKGFVTFAWKKPFL